jgi:hypothetical protein
MLRIQAICLGHKEKFTGNYQTIQNLEEEIFAKYQEYLVEKNVNKTLVRFILTYMDEQAGVEKLLKDINVIKNHGNQWFELSVKRVCTYIRGKVFYTALSQSLARRGLMLVFFS